ncbi:efflux RND transporter permease subunit [Alteromonas flava]|uniref:efflux RND transporter permease subunit n=1 Tax=Alteromonas flava TaxID=2048003 RepID=UPI000C28BBB8|nr:CusA/CzcA family heavy metal efflux RND transporter [Alteromonas flava]
MLTQIITACARWPLLVLLVAGLGLAAGYRAMLQTPVDAIPDLSDVQVIVKVNYPGQAPDLVEQQVTYPLSTILMSVPGSQTVRGYSFFGDAYLYVIFDEDTDLYWARARVLEYLNQAQSELPMGTSIELGPDASGVGWIFQYILRDSSGTQNLADLTRLQDWFIRQELQSVPGVSEIAKVGGMVQTYQVVIDPLKLVNYQLTLAQVRSAIVAANNDVGGSVIELGEAEYMVRSKGYLTSLNDFSTIPLGIENALGTPLQLKDVATVRLGPQTRRGVADWNGEGEVVGGIVVMRDGENALAVIDAIKAKIEQLKPALPPGVTIETAYDRTGLITRAIEFLQEKLVQEMLVVIVVCGLFLLHVRATLIVALCLPSALLLGFALMRMLDINANLMSLGGIAIAIGALVDAAIVMVENVQKHQEEARKHTRTIEHMELVKKACTEVGPALFFSLLIITLSFIPIFALEGQEGRLFSPLAYTKTFVMAAAALLSITLVPALVVLLLKGRVPEEDKNWLNRGLKAMYRPFLNVALRWPWLVVVLAIGLGASAIYPWQKLGSEFMPTFDEGDLLYMPTTLPGVSIQEAGQILQQTDRLIKTIPEVKTVFGKVGRAETATDPAPLTMIETTIQLHPKADWRVGVTLDDIIAELDNTVQFPGLTNAWVQPIKTRIDMLSTGVKTPVGIKLSGDSLADISEATTRIERVISEINGTSSVIGERPLSGRYLDITPDRFAASRYGLTVEDIQDVVRSAIGGAIVATSVQGTERFPINVRYPRSYRTDLQSIKTLPFASPTGAWVTLEQVADIRISDGPSMIKSENARTIGWVFIDLEPQVVMGDYVKQVKEALATVELPQKVTWSIAGQYEYQQRVADKLMWIVPATLVIIFVLLQLLFKQTWQALLVMATLPIALAGSLWMVYWLDFQLSVALAVGMIALAGVAAEFGVVMLLYLNNSWAQQPGSAKDKIRHGALQRVRPKAITVLTIIAGLIPIMLGDGSGSEIMQRIAAPMLGGMLVSPLLSMLVIPAVFWLLKRGTVDKP